MSEVRVGPLGGWGDLQADYGAVGNGVADDQPAIGGAFGDLQNNVIKGLWIPAGTYNVSTGCYLDGGDYINIQGAGAATTRVVWTGTYTEYMAVWNIDGTHYSRIGGVALDGGGVAWSGLRMDKNTGTGNFPTGNELADMEFTGSRYGIHAGAFGVGVAEAMVKRCNFHGNTYADFIARNANTLDWWFWDCWFHGGPIALGNHDRTNTGAGNFHAYRSLFEDHTDTDILIGNTEYMAFRECWSRNSKKVYDSYGIGAACPTTFQRCTILDTTDDVSISQSNAGPMFLVDNVIRSEAGVSSYVAAGPVTIAGGNTFSSAGQVGVPHVQFDTETLVDRATITPTFPTWGGHAALVSPSITEVTAGSTRAQIQTAIDAAVAAGGRAVVHLQSGTYTIDATLTVAASQIQVIGDGATTVLNWTGGGTGPILKLLTPSQVTVRDLGFNGASSTATAVEIEGPDQAGAQVLIDALHCATSATGILVDRLNRCEVEVRGVQVTNATVTGVHARAAKVAIWGGAHGSNQTCYKVTRGGREYISEAWYEGAQDEQAHLDGNGVYLQTMGKIAAVDPNHEGSPTAGTASIAVDGFRGRVTVMGCPMTIHNTVKRWDSRHDAPLLVMGVSGVEQPYYIDEHTNSRGALVRGWRVSQAGAPDEPTYSPGTAVAVTDERTLVPAAGVGAFIKEQLAEYRALDTMTLGSYTGGVTCVELYKLNIDSALNGVWVRGSTAALTTEPGPDDPYTERVLWLVADAQVPDFLTHLSFADPVGTTTDAQMPALAASGSPGTRTHRWCCLQMTAAGLEDMEARLAAELTATTVKRYLTETPAAVLAANTLVKM